MKTFYNPNPRLVHFFIEGTGLDYKCAAAALLRKGFSIEQGLNIGNTRVKGKIVELDAILIEKAENEDDWKWIIYVGMSPRVIPISTTDERDLVTDETGMNLSAINLWRENKDKP
jgi:hypothetical protein